MKKWPIGILVFLPVMTSCIVFHAGGPPDIPPQPEYEYERSQAGLFRETHELLHAVLWMQASAEYGAVCRAAYSLARNALDRALADPKETAALEQQRAALLPEKTAVIIDIDETILDNSPYQAQLILDHKAFDDASWKRWVLRGDAAGIPGALDFIRYAASRGVTVFFVSNRDAETPGDHESPQERATRRNLEDLGFAFPAGEDTVLLKNEMQGWGSDKSSRRAHVARTHRILLLVGDDLADFLPDVRTSVLLRAAKSGEYGNRWGRNWIMLPNLMYGSWEGALYGYDNTLSDGQVLEKKKSHLRGIGD